MLLKYILVKLDCEANLIYLGKDRSQLEYVCLDISKYSEDKLGPLFANGQFGDLRKADPSISGDDGINTEDKDDGAKTKDDR